MSARAYEEELTVARTAALAAATVIQRVGPSRMQRKPDGSPITAADVAAHEIIAEVIGRHFPADGLLSEEAPDHSDRLNHERVWIIDPLDGTRDFVQNTGQFAVHVALAVGGQAHVAVVVEPAAHRVSWAIRGHGAFMAQNAGTATVLQVSSEANLGRCRIGTSRLAPTLAVSHFLESPPPLQGVAMGASTKLMALARGELEACVWLSGSEKEWDTCAPGLIVQEAGGCITNVRGEGFTYNQADLVHRHGIVASNSHVHSQLLSRAQRFFS